LRRLPDELLALESQASYPVEFSERLNREREKMEQQIVSTRELPGGKNHSVVTPQE
jgi:hypothetical protein